MKVYLCINQYFKEQTLSSCPARFLGLHKMYSNIYDNMYILLTNFMN